MDLGDTFHQFKDELARLGGEHPWIIFFAIVLLPGFGFPVSILLLLAGAVWPLDLWLSCLVALLAITLNMLWTHALAVGPAARLVRRWIPHRFHGLFEITTTSRWEAAGIFRLTPGIPLCVQNYMLGIVGVPLRHSLIVGLLVQAVYVFAFIVTGGALFSGNTLFLIIALISLALVFLGARSKCGFRIIRRR